MPVPYYDPDTSITDFVSPHRAEQFVAAGTASAVRAKNGKIVRLYRIPRTRHYESAGASIAAMHSGPSRTTERLRDEDRVVFAPPNIVQHRGEQANGKVRSAFHTPRHTLPVSRGEFLTNPGGLSTKERMPIAPAVPLRPPLAVG